MLDTYIARVQSDHVHFELLSLVIWSRVFWPSWNSSALPNLWLSLVHTLAMYHLLEERNNLWSKFLCHSETLRIQHDLCNQLPVRGGHSQAAEQLLQVVREIGSSSITWIHCDENGHVTAHFDLLAYQFNCNGCGWEIWTNMKRYSTAQGQV